MQRCWEVIDAQAEEALISDGFADIDYDTLKSVLARLVCCGWELEPGAYTFIHVNGTNTNFDTVEPRNNRCLLDPLMRSLTVSLI